jgi:LCP family protein required for cell wall assembly
VTVLDLFSDESVESAPRRTRWARVRKALLIVGVLFSVLLLACVLGVSLLLRHYDNNVTRIPGIMSAEKLPPSERPTVVSPKAMNILLVGSDSRAPQQTTGTGGTAGGVSPIGQRSDTIMLVHLTADRKAAWVISFPRDSWVDIPGYQGKYKINAAFAFGGPSLLIRTLEKLTAVHIDHFAEIDFDGFKAMTDAVGGVDVRVDHSFSAGKYSYNQGIQHITADEALAFVRDRYNQPDADFGRIRNQQAFLQALIARAKSRGIYTNPFALNDLLNAMTSSISVDDRLSGAQMRSIALSLRSAGTHFMTVPVSGTGMVGDQSVVFLNLEKGAGLYDAINNDRLKFWSP